MHLQESHANIFLFSEVHGFLPLDLHSLKQTKKICSPPQFTSSIQFIRLKITLQSLNVVYIQKIPESGSS